MADQPVAKNIVQKFRALEKRVLRLETREHPSPGGAARSFGLCSNNDSDIDQLSGDRYIFCFSVMEGAAGWGVYRDGVAPANMHGLVPPDDGYYVAVFNSDQISFNYSANFNVLEVEIAIEMGGVTHKERKRLYSGAPISGLNAHLAIAAGNYADGGDPIYVTVQPFIDTAATLTSIGAEGSGDDQRLLVHRVDAGVGEALNAPVGISP